MKRSLLIGILIFVAVTALLSIGYDHFFEERITYDWKDFIEFIIIGTGVSILMYSLGKRWKLHYDNKKP